MIRSPLLVVLLGLAPVIGQAQSTLDSACAAPEHRQFDFWVGSWTVTDSSGGTVYGQNDVIRIAGGCGLREHWRAARGGEGLSLNVYQPALGHWTQFWVGAAVVLQLRGGLDAEGRMVLEGERQTPNGPLRDRITWTPLAAGVVRQDWDVSGDGGTSWRRIFEGFYRPRQER